MQTPAVVRGIGSLVFDAIEQTSHIVEGMHATITAVPMPFGERPEAKARGISGFVYGCVRLVNEAVRAGFDFATFSAGAAEPSLATPEWDAFRSAVNGVLGDHLARTGNPLAIPMSVRRDGRPLSLDRPRLADALPGASGKVLVLAHGLCMSDRQWLRRRHDHGAALARDLGYTPVYLHYNSGKHVSENGRELAGLLETLVECWPVPVSEVTILAHSMGGLVARSACSYAAPASRWRAALKTIVFLGTPHHGAPLERGGNWLQTLVGRSPYTAPLARLGMLRSAGITDLRFGNLRDEDWNGCDRFEPRPDLRYHSPLPSGVACYAAAATLSKRAGGGDEALFGDGLVTVASALGRHPRAERTIDFADSRRWVGYGMNHWDLLDRAEVYAKLVEWLNERRSS